MEFLPFILLALGAFHIAGWSGIAIVAATGCFCLLILDVDTFLTENGWIVRHYDDYNEQDFFKRDKDKPAVQELE